LQTFYFEVYYTSGTIFKPVPVTKKFQFINTTEQLVGFVPFLYLQILSRTYNTHKLCVRVIVGENPRSLLHKEFKKILTLILTAGGPKEPLYFEQILVQNDLSKLTSKISRQYFSSEVVNKNVIFNVLL
jgi:hypothetical protein